MRIFIDIGHPAHVHYFRNLIKLMQAKGHEFFVSARDKEFSLALLDYYNISCFNRGKGSSGVAGKALYLFKVDRILYSLAKKFKPDLFLSFASPYAAHVAKLSGKPHIAFTDTENAAVGIISFAPFTNCIITPESFQKDFGPKHIRFKGFMELSYLDPNRFSPDIDILKQIGLSDNEPFALLRFVSWGASHDIGQSGIPDQLKINLVQELSKRMKVFISSEGTMPVELHKYKLQILPEKIHDLLSHASLYIGEGATMASECAMLGTPAIYVNTLTSGTLEQQEDYGLLFCYKNCENVLKKSFELLDNPKLKEEFQKRRQKMLAEQIDVTAFMVWFVENYPDSFRIMKENPQYQDRFR
jgi:predicted glycosyltransferase